MSLPIVPMSGERLRVSEARSERTRFINDRLCQGIWRSRLGQLGD